MTPIARDYSACASCGSPSASFWDWRAHRKASPSCRRDAHERITLFRRERRAATAIPRPSESERFWSKVDRSSPDGCWTWTASRTPWGYGQFHLRGERIDAHRAAWRLEVGDIPAGMFVLHRCDNPPCVRPDHLYIGTAKQNTADMFARGRDYRQRRKRERKRAAALLGWSRRRAVV